MLSKWFVAFVLTASLNAVAEPPSSWLEFKKELNEGASGPTGFYAIQHMLPLKKGETAVLAADRSHWNKGQADGKTIAVDFNGAQAWITGPQIAKTDLLQLKKPIFDLGQGYRTKTVLLVTGVLKVWLYNENAPARNNFRGLSFFDYDPKGVVKARFEKLDQPVKTNFVDSRQEQTYINQVGTLHFDNQGKSYSVKAYSKEGDWKLIDYFSIFLKDQTSGKTTYGGGRVWEMTFPKGQAPTTVDLDLNRIFSFLCVHSKYYNCPISLAQKLDVELPFGEKLPQ